MKAYKIVTMAKGFEIKIDEDEVVKVFNARRTGNDVWLKQGLFNPSSYVGLVEDKSRIFVEREVDGSGYYTGKVIEKYAPLPDIFEGIEALAELKSAEVKRLIG